MLEIWVNSYGGTARRQSHVSEGRPVPAQPATGSWDRHRLLLLWFCLVVFVVVLGTTVLTPLQYRFEQLTGRCFVLH